MGNCLLGTIFYLELSCQISGERGLIWFRIVYGEIWKLLGLVVCCSGGFYQFHNDFLVIIAADCFYYLLNFNNFHDGNFLQILFLFDIWEHYSYQKCFFLDNSLYLALNSFKISFFLCSFNLTDFLLN